MNESTVTHSTGLEEHAPHTLPLNGLGLADDPGAAQLRRMLPVLAVIGAPFAALDGDREAANLLDPVLEWDALAASLAEAIDEAGPDAVPLAVAALRPPTTAHLEQVLAGDGPDAFQMLHIVAYSERDLLYLEDDDGREAYVVAEHMARLLAQGRVRVVILDGCYNARLAEMVITQTPVEAVIGTRRRVLLDYTSLFNTRFYAALAQGEAVQDAYRHALRALKAVDRAQAGRYTLLMADDVEDAPPLHLELADPDCRSPRALIDSGQPDWRGVPTVTGFMGRRDELLALTDMLLALDQRAVVITGAPGAGKSWLAAAWVQRQAWHFPDGVLWLAGHKQLSPAEVRTQIADLLGLPVTAGWDAVRDRLRERHILLVFDQYEGFPPDVWTLFEGIAPGEGGRVIVTAPEMPAALAGQPGVDALALSPLSLRVARQLALRLAVDYDVEALDVDTIDDFLDLTLGQPWMIAHGVRLIRAHGIEAAFEDLATFKPDMSQPLALYVGRHVKRLATEPDQPHAILARAQVLPEAIDADLAAVFGGENGAGQLARLEAAGLLVRDADRLVMPPVVRRVVGQAFRLSAPQRAHVDRFTLIHLLRHWPEDEHGAVTLPLSAEQHARFNNVRAIVARNSGPDAPVDPVLVAYALAAAAPFYLELGLADELVSHAEALYERVEDPRAFARLQIALGRGLAQCDGCDSEAGWAFQVAARTTGAGASTLIAANRAFAQHLLDVHQPAEAARVLGETFRGALKTRAADLVLASSLAHEWALALVAAGRLPDARTRFEAAISGYLRAGEGERLALACSDYAASLVETGAAVRAAQVLETPLPEGSSLRAWGRLWYARGLVYLALSDGGDEPESDDRDEAEAASRRSLLESARDALRDAALAALDGPDRALRGSIYHLLGRAEGRLRQLDASARNTRRAIRLLERADAPDALAAAALTLGRISLAQGDRVTAQNALHRALALGASLQDEHLVGQAAGVLVRLYQAQTRQAPADDRVYRQNVLEQASFSRAQLERLGLQSHVEALDAVVHELSAGS